MNRVLNPISHLKGKVKENQRYYVGFGVKELTDLAKSMPAINDLVTGKKTTVVVTGTKGVLKENTQGKWVRKQPEEKESQWKRIEYYSKKFEKVIKYDREFFKWVKVILHKYNMELELATTPQGEVILHFPQFIYRDEADHYLKVGAAMNMAIVLGKYYMLYDVKFEPIIPVTKYEDRKLLPSGRDLTTKEKLQIIEERLTPGNGAENGAGNSYRFAMLKDHEPTNVTMGLGGFNEYLMFEYHNHNLMVLENLRSGNATFVFDFEKFDKTRLLNKQNAKNDPAFLKRIVHDNVESWRDQLETYFKKN